MLSSRLSSRLDIQDSRSFKLTGPGIFKGKTKKRAVKPVFHYYDWKLPLLITGKRN